MACWLFGQFIGSLKPFGDALKNVWCARVTMYIRVVTWTASFSFISLGDNQNLSSFYNYSSSWWLLSRLHLRVPRLQHTCYVIIYTIATITVFMNPIIYQSVASWLEISYSSLLSFLPRWVYLLFLEIMPKLVKHVQGRAYLFLKTGQDFFSSMKRFSLFPIF